MTNVLKGKQTLTSMFEYPAGAEADSVSTIKKLVFTCQKSITKERYFSINIQEVKLIMKTLKISLQHKTAAQRAKRTDKKPFYLNLSI